MARKPKVESTQVGLGFAPPPRVEMRPETQALSLPPSVVTLAPVSGVGLDLDELDDYDEAVMHGDVPRLRLADPLPLAAHARVELVNGQYEVTRVRHEGTSLSAIRWTRDELYELHLRIIDALGIK